MYIVEYLYGELVAVFHQALLWSQHLPLYVVIGTIGLWRWSMWLAKRLPAFFYRPVRADFACTATVVTAVYNEDPDLFRRALASWLKAGPDRIIAVIDVTDTRCLAVAQEFPEIEVLPNALPGKRPAVAAGVAACQTEIVVLADSDVLWSPDVLIKLKRPFADPKIGGVSARAFMIPSAPGKPTLWERLAEMFLEMRFSAEVPTTSRWGRATSCLSGRTSAYRTAVLQSVREPFLNETFLGRPCISGDDKRYTMLVLERGYATWYQLDAHVYSTFKPTLLGFTQQRIRWYRNSFRSDLRALGKKWIWRHPYLAFILIDKHVALLTQFNGPVIFLAAIYQGHWAVGLALLIWWHLSRALKIAGHLRRKPADIWIYPAFIGVSFYVVAVRCYAFFTMNKQGWLTRPVSLHGGQVIRVEAAA
jgi:cellulose synthase/poly-beta-1,6-N-acetylglucosamine synthase-like glycosyltransferase